MGGELTETGPGRQPPRLLVERRMGKEEHHMAGKRKKSGSRRAGEGAGISLARQRKDLIAKKDGPRLDEGQKEI